MSQTTRKEILERLRRRYRTAGPKPKRKLLDPAQEWLGDHRKAAVRALGGAGGGAGAVAQRRAPGERRAQRPPALAAADWAGDRLRLWAASGRDVAGGDPGLRGARAPAAGPGAGQAAGGQRAHAGPVAGAPLRGQGQGRSRTRPGPLLRQQIPIRGSVWAENQAGWLEVDTVALCGGRVAGEFVWLLDGVDYAPTGVEVRALWGRGQAGTLAAWQNIEAGLPFALLGLDRDNGGEFLNPHVLQWLQQRPRPVFLTRSRPGKQDDHAPVEQKNWTPIRQCFGYERHDPPDVVEPIPVRVQGAYGQLLNSFHATLKRERTARTEGRLQRLYGAAQTPWARGVASPEVTPQTKRRLPPEKARLNPFARKREVDRSLKTIAAQRQARPCPL